VGGGAGDFCQIHYDTAFAQNTGLDGVIVHGTLKHAWLVDLPHRFAGPEGRVQGTVPKKVEEGGDHLVELEV
jgi:acyl dehydratase